MSIQWHTVPAYIERHGLGMRNSIGLCSRQEERNAPRPSLLSLLHVFVLHRDFLRLRNHPINDFSKTEGLATWHNGQKPPTAMPAASYLGSGPHPGCSVSTQFPVSLGKQRHMACMAGFLHPHPGDLEEAPGCTLAQPQLRGYLGSVPTDG